MNYKVIDLNTYKRKEHYDYFKTLKQNYFDITVNVDITNFMKVIKENNYPFFLSFLYLVGKAANSIDELKQRILDDKIVQYDYCMSSYTLALDNGTYRYCNADTSLDFKTFLIESKKQQDTTNSEERLKEDEEYMSYLFVSSMPWITYSSLSPVKTGSEYAIPSFEWCKYYKGLDNKIYVPLTLSVSHALIDGSHAAKFYQVLQELLNKEIIE